MACSNEAYDSATMSSSLRSTHSAIPPSGAERSSTRLGVIGFDTPQQCIVRRLLRLHAAVRFANYGAGRYARL
jgi:hypothetical protein